jgi:uncharacterized Zn-finger protein
MRCANCHQDILQANPVVCPYCRGRKFEESLPDDQIEDDSERLKTLKEIKRLERTGHYKEAALKRKELETVSVKEGKIGSISMKCPYCGSSQTLVSKSNEVVCAHCKKSYAVPEKVLDLL